MADAEIVFVKDPVKFQSLLIQKRDLQRKLEDIQFQIQEANKSISAKSSNPKIKELEKLRTDVEKNEQNTISKFESKLPKQPKKPNFSKPEAQGRDWDWYSEGRSNLVTFVIQQKEITPEQREARAVAKKAADARRQQQLNILKKVGLEIGKSVASDLEKIVDVVVDKTAEEFPAVVNVMKEDDLEPEEKVKYVATFVGDSTAGKSALIQAILNKPFPEEHVPSSFETFDLEGKFSDEKLGNFNGPVEIWDSDVTQETKLYATFKASNVIVLCFSLVDYQSYLHLVKWKNLIESQVSPNIPVVLVGTKSDKLDSAQLARTGKSGFYSYSSANAYSKQLGCTNFLLTSAKNNDGIDEAWKEILKWKFFKYVPKPKEKGSLMDRLEKTKDNLLPYQK